MICTSIQNKGLEEIFNLIPELEMAEIRLDRCPDLNDDDIRELFESCDIPLIATCRVAESKSADEAEHKLALAIEAGAKYLDLEIEAPVSMGKKLRRSCLDAGTIMIRSFHDFHRTPSIELLSEKLSLCRKFGGEIVKIVTTALNEADWELVRKLYGDDMEGHLIAFCMGEAGRTSRLECLAEGAPFTYAAISANEASAPGQMTVEEMKNSLYGSDEAHRYHNDVQQLPASKSFAQRAIVAAALSEGTSHLSGYSPCADSEASISVAEALGASVERHPNEKELIITGIGPDYSKLKLNEIHTGESGLLTRLMIPIAALLGDGNTIVNGTGTLLKRPLSGANDIMAAFGVMLTSISEHNSKEVFVPARVKGRLIPGRAEISGKGGSQLISGLLTALPLADNDSIVYVRDPKSIPYMFITIDVLRKFGIKIINEMEGGDDFLETRDWNFCSGMTFKIRGGQSFKAADFNIEADWSSAANFMVAGAVFGSARLGGLDISSLQADLSILDILVEAGASISQEETGEINVYKAPLNAFSINLSNTPDLFPPVAVLAAFCPGESRLGGVSRLSGKESNRAEAIKSMLERMGVPTRIEGDEMIVKGQSLSRRLMTGNMLKCGDFTSCHDHRMAMALKVAELGAAGPLSIDDTDCLNKSYPSFLSDFSTS